MEIFNFTFLILFSFFSFLLLIVFSVSVYLNYKLNKKINEMNQDISDALTKTITYIQKEFKNNSDTHQDTVDWQFSNFEKIVEFENQNFNLLLVQISNLANSFNIIMDLLGYRPKFDESQIDKAQVNYAQPPAPKKIEGLKINDRDKS